MKNRSLWVGEGEGAREGAGAGTGAGAGVGNHSYGTLRPGSFVDEEMLLRPLHLALVSLLHAGRERVEGGWGGDQAAFGLALERLADQLLTLFSAAQYLRRHVTHPVAFDWAGRYIQPINPTHPANPPY